MRCQHHFELIQEKSPTRSSLFRESSLRQSRTRTLLAAPFGGALFGRLVLCGTVTYVHSIMSSHRVCVGARGGRVNASTRAAPRLVIRGVFSVVLFLTVAMTCLAPVTATANTPKTPHIRHLVEIEDMDLELVGMEGVEEEHMDFKDNTHAHSNDKNTKLPKNYSERLAFEDALGDIEERLYGTSSIADRNIEDAFRELLMFVSDAPTLQKAKDVTMSAARKRNGNLVVFEAEMKVWEAYEVRKNAADEVYRVALERARSPLNKYFGIAVPEPLLLTPLNDGRGGVSVEFGFVKSLGESSDDVGASDELSRKGARLLEALARRNGFETSEIKGYEEVDAPDDAEQNANSREEQQSRHLLDSAVKHLSRAVETAATAAGAAASLQTATKPEPIRFLASLDDLPADWRATADGLYLLGSILESGTAPTTDAAYPEFKVAIDGSVEKWADVFTVDTHVDAPLVAPSHPALSNPKQWANTAIFVAAEMGSREARLAAGDRVLRDRGVDWLFHEEREAASGNLYLPASSGGDSGNRCERAVRTYLLPVAEQIANLAEQSGEVQVPGEPARLRDRDRDAEYVDNADHEDDGNAQVEMERDMASRGVTEAERHLGYRALVGRGVPRDEALALQRFENAANQGDPLAMFNLGYMHMKGVGGTVKNYTKARELFENAADADIGAAYNGLGVLDYNGWGMAGGAEGGTDEGAGPDAGANGNANDTPGTPDINAARIRFELGAALGDPDALYNLATLYQTGSGGLSMDRTEAYSRFLAASDAGHWRAPLAVAKARLEGYGVDKDCMSASLVLQQFVEERLTVFADEHEDSLAALEGGFVDLVHTENEVGTGQTDAFDTEAPTDSDGFDPPSSGEFTQVGPDPWSALVRYSLIAERGGETGLANAAWLLKQKGTRRGVSVQSGNNFPVHLSRQVARAGAKSLLTRLAQIGDPEAHVDLGDVKWAGVVEGDDDDERLEKNESPKNDVHPRPPKGPAPKESVTLSGTPPVPIDVDTGNGSDDKTHQTKYAHEENDGLHPPRLPAPATPPPGSDKFSGIIYHYREASLWNLPEGSVSLAWAHFRGIGVTERSYTQAEKYLWKAHDDSVDEIESFVPLVAVLGVKLVKVLNWLLDDGVFSIDPIKVFDKVFGATDVNKVLYPEDFGEIKQTGNGFLFGHTQGFHSSHKRVSIKGTGRGPTGNSGNSQNIFLKLEDCVLCVLVASFVVVGYVRFIALSGEGREETARLVHLFNPLGVLGVLGVIAAAAWAV